MKLGLEKLAKDQKQDSDSATMKQSVGQLGLAKTKMPKDDAESEDSKMLVEQTRQSGENSMDKKAAQMGLARVAAKAIKGPAKVNEVMKKVPSGKRGDVLAALRKSKK